MYLTAWQATSVTKKTGADIKLDQKMRPNAYFGQMMCYATCIIRDTQRSERKKLNNTRDYIY
jgi:hypothetical protein